MNLRPCPFCGDTKQVQLMQADARGLLPWCDERGSRSTEYVVVCAIQYIAGARFGCGSSSGYSETAAGAINRWNRRSV